MDDTACPWCGVELYNPFNGNDVKTHSEYDQAMEAHVEDCEPWLAEQGG